MHSENKEDRESPPPPYRQSFQAWTRMLPGRDQMADLKDIDRSGSRCKHCSSLHRLCTCHLVEADFPASTRRAQQSFQDWILCAPALDESSTGSWKEMNPCAFRCVRCWNLRRLCTCDLDMTAKMGGGGQPKISAGIENNWQSTVMPRNESPFPEALSSSRYSRNSHESASMNAQNRSLTPNGQMMPTSPYPISSSAKARSLSPSGLEFFNAPSVSARSSGGALRVFSAEGSCIISSPQISKQHPWVRTPV
jgi:hypothetical protein